MSSKTTNKFAPEIRARAARMILDHDAEHGSWWATVVSMSGKIGCTAQTLNEWVKKAERDSEHRAGPTSDMTARLKALERENREFRQANEILRKASAYCPGGARRPTQAMITFIDGRRGTYGVDPMCRVLPIAASTYHGHVSPGAPMRADCRRDRSGMTP